MKHLIFGVALLLSSAVEAQFPNLPYNPDDNGDGLIGVVDLQGLLANYGNEFSSAIVSEDGESAIVYMGEMGYPHCKYSCDHLPGLWSLPEVEDLVPVWEEATSTSPWTWLTPADYTSNLTGGTYSTQKSLRFASDGINLAAGLESSRRCYCTAKQLPRVEYSACIVNTAQTSNFLNCCAEKVSEGWYPLDNAPSGASNHFSQAFWRWAE